ncbi:TauD/TfdA family dioxygenase [Pendulispora brunnea]|uniref:TauD/TfdA family dioxygenase n=1 Tax=Pendulispora brunnea TaxID=2905690 RepID=A0ABZ2JYS9_9BACT
MIDNTMFEIDDDRLPAIVQPRNGRSAHSLDALVTWCRAHQPDVKELLQRKGAILFRGFEVRSAEDFAHVARAISEGSEGSEGSRASQDGLVEYVAGVARRKKITDGIYTSTEYPSHVDMPCHNELSHTKDWIALIFFFCQVAPKERGETPLVDGREVVRGMKPETAALFREKRVTYVRFLHCGDGSGILENNVRVLDASGYPYSVSWQHTYGTTDKSVVEANAKRVGADIEWTSSNDLIWRETVQAIRRHPETREESWFSHVVNFHPSRMAPAVRKRIPEKEYPRNVVFGDGTPIADSIVDEIRDCVAKGEKLFAWQKGDVLMIDNVLVAHGRRTFEGPRTILTAMAGLREDSR